MDEQSSYRLGWNDGYSEGYACKLADATEPFIPTLQVRPDEVQAVASWLLKKYSALIADESEAIGVARGMLLVASQAQARP